MMDALERMLRVFVGAVSGETSVELLFLKTLLKSDYLSVSESVSQSVH